MSKAIFQPLSSFVEYPQEEMKQRALAYRMKMQRRRSVRDFSDRPAPREIIEECLRVAGLATPPRMLRYLKFRRSPWRRLRRSFKSRL